MNPRLCSCGAAADFSACVLLSSLRRRPRQQKCGEGQLFCLACIHRAIESKDPETLARLTQSLVSAYAAFTSTPASGADASRPLLGCSAHESGEFPSPVLDRNGDGGAAQQSSRSRGPNRLSRAAKPGS